MISKLCWKLKLGWYCVGGNHLDGGLYRYVWHHLRTGEVRTEEKSLK